MSGRIYSVGTGHSPHNLVLLGPEAYLAGLAVFSVDLEDSLA